MPEYRELLAHLLILLYLLRIAFTSGSTFTILGLWADYTKAEAKRQKKNSRARKGLVCKLDNKCIFKRGTKGCQTSLYPPMLQKKKGNPNPEPLSVLRLESPEAVTATNRALILNFGRLYLSVSGLDTHFLQSNDVVMSSSHF
jgi:hypothetical protein